MTSPPTRRFLLVDDHPAVRQGLALVLAEEGVGDCRTARGKHELPGKGENTFEIAAALPVGTHTVESYYERIKVKLSNLPARWLDQGTYQVSILIDGAVVGAARFSLR